MASSEPNKRTEISELNQDYISSLPTELTDDILKRLPLSMAAKMSVLSRKWLRNWLSLRYFVFDQAFWEKHQSIIENGNGNSNRERINNIISSIMLNHTGPVHEFYLHVPNDRDQVTNLNLGHWLSFLSRASIQKIILENMYEGDDNRKPVMPSHIYSCKELLDLKIVSFVLNPPLPSDDCCNKSFANLQSLVLLSVEFKPGVFRNLIASCPRLINLRLEHCIGITNLVFDNVPTLECLTVQGTFASLAFRNITRLRCISLSLSPMENTSYFETVHAILILAIPPVRLRCLYFDGLLCKFLATGCYKKLTQPFNHLRMLSLTKLDLSDFNVFCFIIAMVQNCPYIKTLNLSSITPKNSMFQHKFDYDDKYKHKCLVKVKITGITGSSAELELIEYVLRITVKLNTLVFKCNNLTPSAELEVVRELLQFPRASTKAKLVCLAR